MEATRNLRQPMTWNPLDLTDEGLPVVRDAANGQGSGFLPDLTDTRPELRPVRAPHADASSPTAPWDQ